MALTDDRDVARRLAALAEELTAAGYLRSPRWRRAFLAVRRHVFVPRYWHDDDPGAFPARWRMVDRATRDHGEWLDAVYSNRTLATELTGTPAVTGEGMHPQVTSSSTMPGLVLAMLDDLDVADGMTVLEVGTGTGYDAALLCERLGDGLVTSVDLGPELVALARVRLAAHGYHPCLVTGDGAAGVPGRAPFDRVLATCGVGEIPAAWITQSRDGGKILANLSGPFNAHALVLLTVTGDTASGPFLRQSGGFMPRRTDPDLVVDPRAAVHRVATDPTDGHSPLDPRQLYTDPTWGLLAQTHLTGVVSRQVYLDDTENLGTELASPDGTSWALVHHEPDRDGHHLTQAGPRRLWDELDTLHQRWVARDRPDHHRFGLTASPDGPTRLWLDHPERGFT
ncbi:MAG: methyltransferase domain-containing protein [Pseudonocardia sp.]